MRYECMLRLHQFASDLHSPLDDCIGTLQCPNPALNFIRSLELSSTCASLRDQHPTRNQQNIFFKQSRQLLSCNIYFSGEALYHDCNWDNFGQARCRSENRLLARHSPKCEIFIILLFQSSPRSRTREESYNLRRWCHDQQ